MEKARTDPAFFIHYVTGEEPVKHHRIWLANLFSPHRKRCNFIAPRESAKTTILAYATAFQIGRNPLASNGLISVSSEIAETRLRMIRATIQENTRYHNVFPHIHIDERQPNTQTQFSVMSDYKGMTYNNWRRLVETKGSPKDPTLFVAGAGGRGIIGRRFSGWLLMDDIIDERSLSDEAQEKMEQYIMQTLIPCVKEMGKVVNVGTRWMLGDIPARLKNNPEWHTVEIAATLYDENGVEHSYWPSYWPLDRLKKKRREMNNDALYFIMYENDPRAMTRALFTEPQLRREIPVPMPKLHQVFISTDLAISEKTAADFTVFHALGIDLDNNVFLLDQMRMKTSVDEMVNALVGFSKEIATRWGKLDAVLFENVGFQSVVQQLVMKVDPGMPAIGVVPRGDKGHRASFVSDWVRRGKFFINQAIPDLEQLISEWMNFPLHKHDDTLDPTSLLFQHLNLAITAAEVTHVHSEYLT